MHEQGSIVLSFRMYVCLMCFMGSLPSVSSIKQERSAFLFREKGSAKLRSDGPPPQADGRVSRSIFPPHVTLRLGILTQDESCQDCDNEEKAVFLLETRFCVL